MFFPLYDRNPLKVIRFQTVTVALIVVNVLIFLWMQLFLEPTVRTGLYLSFGLVPAVVSGKAALAEELHLIPALASVVTYMFLHGGWMHLIGNMAFLWVFADNVEDSFGHIGFLLFYIACGIVAGLCFLLLAPAARIPLVGASGAISGVLASYLVLFPRSKVFSVLGVVPINLPALWLLLAWLAFNFFFFLTETMTSGGVAWIAHLGGFAAGLGFTLLLRNRIRLRLARGAALKRQRERNRWEA